MKKITFAFLLFGCSFAFSQTLTQSSSQVIENLNSIACQQEDIAIGDNSYYRAFDMSTYDITTDFAISAIQFGIERIDDTSTGTYPITVRLYTTTAIFPEGFPETGYELLAEQVYDVPEQALSLYNAPLIATVPAGSDLIVRISYPADPDLTAVVFLGSNDNGETAPTYISSTVCMLPTPQTIDSLGITNADMDMVINVVGPVILGVGENHLGQVSFYPNPTKGLVNFSLPNSVSLQKAYIADMTGKQIPLDFNDNSVNISRLQTGVYALTLVTNEGNVTKKIVKE